MSLARLGLVAAAAVAAAVLLASVVVYFIVQNELRGQVDRSLRDQVRAGRSSASPTSSSPRRGSRPSQYLLQVAGRGRSASPFQLVDRDGGLYRPATSFGRCRRPALPGGRQARSRSRPASATISSSRTHFNGQHVRLLAARLPGRLRDRGGDAADERRPRARRRSASGCCSSRSAASGSRSVVGFLVARAALKPVRDLSETAEHVRATRDLSQRIEVHRQRRAQPARDHLQRDARSRSTRRSSGSGSSSRTPRTSCARR